MDVQKIFGDLAPPSCTAKSWAIYDGNTGEILFGKNENERREVASMTKIMTCFVVVSIIRKLDLDMENTMIQVSKTSAMTNGCSAKLRTGDVLSLWDMLHGAMLPSGNDACICLAEHFGHYIYEASRQNRKDREPVTEKTLKEKPMSANKTGKNQP